MKQNAKALYGRFEKTVWGVAETPLPLWKERAQRGLRTVFILTRDLVGGQLTLRAMSLVYTTLLSIVPLLALSFSVLKAFGVYNQIEPMLLKFVEPLGEKGDEIVHQISIFIEKMNVGVLGALGLTLLLYTAISLMQKIEESLNFIWHIPHPRPLADRFSRYLSVLLVGPILVFSALGITASVMNIETVRDLMEINILGQAMQAISRLTPYFLVTVAFTFIYLFIPNSRVRVVPALIGGVAGGFAWQTAGWVFAVFIASSNKYAAIYSSLAILILFMIWLYLSWLILLFGASVAFYAQHPEYLYARSGEPRLSNRMRERLALSVMSLVSGRFLAGEPMPSLAEFTRLLGVPMHSLQIVLVALEGNRFLAQSSDEPPRFLPSRDPSLILVTQVLETVRAAGEEQFLSPGSLPAPPPVDELLNQIQQAVESSVSNMTMRDLALQISGRALHEPVFPKDS
ncbi:Ribonuclease BN [Candidatus Propionivibrio aalborgensis]|uniref:Ribonuclease BN n=1 Tax=Candidatus Propionivibrio aalborgensis TaxID=1860101 RepID=A0A1A8XMD4_9RHOO|nr:YihY/virulence factor BrkB family protein [Candidatus Propionivibrio aalborgensis]SBT05821.1 Ribonuclease BN [Candidatus Propionivibrio aalborgensis]